MLLRILTVGKICVKIIKDGGGVYMGNYKYVRDLPVGIRHYFEKPPARLLDEKYFDDFLKIDIDESNAEPLEIHCFGNERSYPGRILNRITGTYMIHYVTEGCGTFNGQTVGKGQGFLIVPGVLSSIASDKDDPWHFKWISFSGREAAWIMRLIGLDEGSPVFNFDFFDKLEDIASDVLYSDRSECDMEIYLKGVFYIVMSYHKRSNGVNTNQTGAGVGYVRKAMEYIDSHYGEDVRIDSIAESLHISRKYLCALFNKSIRMSPKEYLLYRRMEVAARLLIQTDMSVSAIASEVGYADYTQLSRIFKEKKGMSPLQYRKLEIYSGDEIRFLK